jgi:7-carboxy-7-deazaguanine synthase
MSVDEIVSDIELYSCRLVELTGGEPLLQDDVYALIDCLLRKGWEVLVETGGHVPLDRVPSAVVKIMDVKCPGSGEAEQHDWNNLRWLTDHDQMKFVLRDRIDYEFARDAVVERDLVARCAAVLMSPVHGVLAPKTLAKWVLADGLQVRVQLQVHKYIWGADARGV